LEAYKFVDALTTEEFKGAKAKSLEEVRKVINIQAIGFIIEIWPHWGKK